MGSQEQKILERFGRTAGVFSDFVLSERAQDMRKVVAWLKPEEGSLVLDVACGPGTLALAFAPSVAGPDSPEASGGAGVIGLDLTPEMLLRARQEAETSGCAHCWFCRGHAEALPFADATFDIVSCAYSFHHLAQPDRVFEEMLRVTRPGGRILVVDIIAPEEDDRAARQNEIERLRDASHTLTLKLSELAAASQMCSRGGTSPEWFLFDRDRDFEDWMAVAGIKAGTPIYDECFELMWRSMDGDAAGFAPHWEDHRLHFVQHSVAVATRPAVGGARKQP